MVGTETKCTRHYGAGSQPVVVGYDKEIKEINLPVQ